MMTTKFTPTLEMIRGKCNPRRKYIFTKLIVCGLAWSVPVFEWPSIAWSQTSSVVVPSTPIGVGTNESAIQVFKNHSVSHRPTKIRLMIRMQAESRQLETCLTDLKDHIKNVRKEVSEIDAIESSVRVYSPTIKMGTPGIDNPDEARKSLRSQQMMQARMMRAAGGGRNMLQPEISERELPIIYTSTTHLVVDWSLPNSSSVEPSDELTLLPARLIEKAKEQDWTGKNLRVELNDEEQAAIDELASPGITSSIVYGGLQSNPEIQFIYLAEITQKDKVEGLKVAFQSSKDQLEEIAKQMNKTLKRTFISQTPNAAGFLGSLPSISTFAPHLTGQAALRQIYVSENEVGSLDPDGLIHAYSVSATGTVDQ